MSPFPLRMDDSAETASDIPLLQMFIYRMDSKKSYQSVIMIAHHKSKMKQYQSSVLQ